MKLKYAICLIFILLFNSYSNIIYIKRENIGTENINQINYLGKSRTGTLILIDRSNFDNEKINMSIDSLNFLKLKTLYVTPLIRNTTGKTV